MTLRRRVEASGHLIDRAILHRILNAITTPGGSYELLSLDAGQRPEDRSSVSIDAYLPDPEADAILHNLVSMGCLISAGEDDDPDCLTNSAPGNGIVPDDFYVTTNHPTYIRTSGQWVPVRDLRMDCAIVTSGHHAYCTKMRDIQRGDSVVIGYKGIRVTPFKKPHKRPEFCFMSSDASSERNSEATIARLAETMTDIRNRRGRIIVIAGPAVIHTGAAPHLAAVINMGYVNALLAGNALPVHDIEAAMFNTSLGVDLSTGDTVYDGNRNHLRAINNIRAAGSIKQAVAAGLLTSGIFYECIQAGVPFALAGSIRDDGPLPDTTMDLIAAQDEYAQLLSGADIVLMLATLLHSIGAGNMLPSAVQTVCIDINPSTVLKLVDRGSGQVSGLITDIGPFLRELAHQLTPDTNRPHLASEKPSYSAENPSPSSVH